MSDHHKPTERVISAIRKAILREDRIVLVLVLNDTVGKCKYDLTICQADKIDPTQRPFWGRPRDMFTRIARDFIRRLHRDFPQPIHFSPSLF